MLRVAESGGGVAFEPPELASFDRALGVIRTELRGGRYCLVRNIATCCPKNGNRTALMTVSRFCHGFESVEETSFDATEA
jgi:hypothetical protein